MLSPLLASQLDDLECESRDTTVSFRIKVALENETSMLSYMQNLFENLVSGDPRQENFL
jgi:hypothetical protein